MREFENLVYMDLQKSATTTIVALLRNILDEKEVPHGGHTPAKKGHDKKRLHFISVRNPMGIYISLFGHGCSKKGGLYRELKERWKGNLYEPSPGGFERWLEFMLEPANASYINKKYDKMGMSEIYAPITFRLITLSLLNPLTRIRRQNFTNHQEILYFFHKRRVYNQYVRTEHLAEDLYLLLTEFASQIKLKAPLTTFEAFKAMLPSRNVGARIEGLTVASVSPELRQRVREREWLLYDVFGYDDDPKGRPPPLPPRGEPLTGA